jgi:II/X family phage/plasmid replication protein
VLIDWLTARIPFEHIDRAYWEDFRLLTDRVMRFCPRTGETKWEAGAWDSVRSDSHQIAFRVGGDAVWLQGSPARVCGDGDAVFGSGASASLDLSGCLGRMIRFVSDQVGISLPLDVTKWLVSRTDVTGNLLLDDLAAVRIALKVLRECEGGRYRVSQQSGDTVYWSHRSRLQSGKAYAKGPHIQYMTKRPGYTGRGYSQWEMDVINRLLRLELKIGSQYFRERVGKPWYEITPEELKSWWCDYFLRMIGSAEMSTEADIKERLFQVVIDGERITEGRAKAAYGCFLMIKNEGWEKAREAFSKTTWYRHLQILRLAGLGDADIAAGTVVPFRRKVIESQLVSSWVELRNVA